MTRYIYPALLVVLVGIVLAPLLLHPNYLLYPRDGQATDLTITHWPAVAFNVRSLRQDGQIPFWRTAIASGGPWAANPQSWLYYPPAWLFYLLPISLTFNLLLLAHLLLAVLGTYAFGQRALGLEPQGAALAGLAFALAPWISGQLSAGHVNVVLAVAWLPVALLGAHHAATNGRAGGALLAGVAWAATLLNHVQMAAFIVALTVAWFLFAMLKDSAVDRKRQPGLLFLTPVVAVPLSAALLIPLAEMLPYLNRALLGAEEAGIFSLSWAQLLTALIPTYGGQPEQVIYLGLPGALLAVVGLAMKRDGVAWFLVNVATLAAVFALGTHTPLFPLLVRWVPGLGWLRVPPRAWVLVAFCVALLAGRGLDALTHRQLPPTLLRRVNLIGLGALAAGLILAAGLLFLYRPAPRAAWAMAALTVLAVGALMLRAHSWLGPRPFAIVILLLVAADLGLVRTAWTEMRAPTDAFAWHAETAEYLARQPGQFRTYSPSYSLPQHVALQHDLYLADGVDPIQLTHYAKFLALAGGYEAAGYSPSLPPILDDTSAQPDAARLGLLNVGYVAASFPIEAEGLVLEEQLDSTYVYRNAKRLPRAFVAPYDQTATEGDLPLQTPVDPGPARIDLYTPNRIVVEAELGASALLVLSEVWYPGWRALDNGQEVPIRCVAGTLRGVFLDRGSHTVEFRYMPWTVRVGVAISGATALALLACAAYRVWRNL
jgi:hypothetical protein